MMFQSMRLKFRHDSILSGIIEQSKCCGSSPFTLVQESDWVETNRIPFVTTQTSLRGACGRIKSHGWRDGVLLYLSAFAILGSLSACKERKSELQKPLIVRYTPSVVLQSNDSIGVFAVVEIPAGTTRLQTIDTAGRVVPISDHPVDFLPFPGNYGFIAGCGKVDSMSGVLVPLPVLVMMHALETQSIVEVKPLAVLVLRKAGKPHPIVIAVPADSTLQSIKVGGFVDFLTEYDATRHILQQWFLNYQGHEMFGFTGWRDDHYAQQLISDWKLKE